MEPHYRKAGNGRQQVGLEKMLRIYFAQQWSRTRRGGQTENWPSQLGTRRPHGPVRIVALLEPWDSFRALADPLA